jgi:hypothetical protein
MAETKMDLSAFVGKLLEEQDGETLRGGSGFWRRHSWRAKSRG